MGRPSRRPSRGAAGRLAAAIALWLACCATVATGRSLGGGAAREAHRDNRLGTGHGGDAASMLRSNRKLGHMRQQEAEAPGAHKLQYMQEQEAGASGVRQDSRNTVPSSPNDKHNTKFVPMGHNVPSSVQNEMQVGATPSSTRRVFPDNVRPLNSAVEDSAAPVFPGKDLPVFPPEQGPDSIRITGRDSTSVTLAWDAPEGTIPTMYNLLMVSANQAHIPRFRATNTFHYSPI